MDLSRSHLSVVHLLAPATVGGLETVVETLAAGQAAAGDDVCVAAVLSDGDVEPHPFVEAVRGRGVDVEVLRLSGRAYVEERRRVADLLGRSGADVLHTHGYRPDVVAAPVARARGVGTVTTVHGYTGGGGVKGRLYEWLQTRAFRRFDAVVAVSEKLRGDLVRAGVPAARAHALPNAWESTSDLLPRRTARERLGLPPDEDVVGWVGRLSPEKAPDLALKALAASRTPCLHLSVIGSGPLEQEARALAATLGLGERVRWHGVVPRAGLALAALDVLLITSWTEGTPATLLEAMAAGVPVVSTAVGGIPAVVGSEEAWLVPAGDVDALAAALDQVLANPHAAQARAAAARRRLKASFAVGPWVERYRDIYQSVVGG